MAKIVRIAFLVALLAALLAVASADNVVSQTQGDVTVNKVKTAPGEIDNAKEQNKQKQQTDGSGHNVDVGQTNGDVKFKPSNKQAANTDASAVVSAKGATNGAPASADVSSTLSSNAGNSSSQANANAHASSNTSTTSAVPAPSSSSNTTASAKAKEQKPKAPSGAITIQKGDCPSSITAAFHGSATGGKALNEDFSKGSSCDVPDGSQGQIAISTMKSLGIKFLNGEFSASGDGGAGNKRDDKDDNGLSLTASLDGAGGKLTCDKNGCHGGPLKSSQKGARLTVNLDCSKMQGKGKAPAKKPDSHKDDDKDKNKTDQDKAAKDKADKAKADQNDQHKDDASDAWASAVASGNMKALSNASGKGKADTDDDRSSATSWASGDSASASSNAWSSDNGSSSNNNNNNNSAHAYSHASAGDGGDADASAFASSSGRRRRYV